MRTKFSDQTRQGLGRKPLYYDKKQHSAPGHGSLGCCGNPPLAQRVRVRLPSLRLTSFVVLPFNHRLFAACSLTQFLNGRILR